MIMQMYTSDTRKMISLGTGQLYMYVTFDTTYVPRFISFKLSCRLYCVDILYLKQLILSFENNV